MDEIDRGIGFQEVAPGALARMRLSRNEEHAKIFADAVEHMHGAVVRLRHLAGNRIDGEFQDVVAAARNGEAERQRLVPGSACSVAISLPFRRIVTSALPPEPRRHPRPERSFSAVRRRCEAGGADDFDAPVELVRLAADQGVDGCIEAELLVDVRHVVDLAVGNEDGAADTAGGTSASAVVRAPKSLVEGASFPRVAASTIRASIWGKRERRSLSPSSAWSGLRAAVTVLLALAAVDNDGDDGGEGFALLLEEDGICKREENAAAPPALIQAPRTPRQIPSAARNNCDKRQVPRDTARREAARNRLSSPGPHCPSRSSRAGTAPGRPCSCRSACTS